jgi:large subunit ribosomal protein L6
MSRVAKLPIALPKGVEVSIAADAITVKGPKGTLSQSSIAGVSVVLANGELAIAPANNDSDALAGTMRALLANMVHGVSTGFERKLELVGVGYRATMQGKDLGLALGFSHPIVFKVPAGVSVETPTQTEVLVKGSDKQLVGQVAAKIRAFRKPEPYKGKGVRYAGEKINMKEAKKA